MLDKVAITSVSLCPTLHPENIRNQWNVTEEKPKTTALMLESEDFGSTLHLHDADLL